ncbi:MAG: methionine biosynthesis protein MetW [Candidatus Omnitrophica bacterium]|nr:methionine biosynthesis protein MetW [Candidatus Omnitrophota bacterium]
MQDRPKRLDNKIIYSIIEPESKVLDLGCGNGELIYSLSQGKKVRAQGVELSEEAIYRCVEKGLSVFHTDIDSGLSEYPDRSFDYVILNQTMQEAKRAEFVIQEALRVGKKAIVGFPNFAYIKARAMVFFQGKTPVTSSLPYRWYNTPNLHFLSISDFKAFCNEEDIKIVNAYYLAQDRIVRFWPNLFALNAIFVISR